MKAYLEWGADKVTIDRIEPTHYFRNRMVLRLIKKLSKKHQIKEVCEIGCGTGSLSLNLGKSGLKVDAFDIDKNAVALAKNFSSNKNVRYISKDALYINSSRKYDMVMAIEVLEHIKEDSKVLLKLKNILKKNGLLFITVPIHEKYRKSFDNRSGHIRRYNPDDLLQKVRNAGFDVQYVRYFNFPLLWVWYFRAYIPYSDRKEREVSALKSKRLPKYAWIVRILNKLFFLDMLFNSKKYSTDMLVIGKKRNN